MYTPTIMASNPTSPKVHNLPWWFVTNQTTRGHTATVAAANIYLPSRFQRGFTRSMVSGRTTRHQLAQEVRRPAQASQPIPWSLFAENFERADLGDHGLPAHISQVLVAGSSPDDRRRRRCVCRNAFPDAPISVDRTAVCCNAERHIGYGGVSEQPLFPGTCEFVCWPRDQR